MGSDRTGRLGRENGKGWVGRGKNRIERMGDRGGRKDGIRKGRDLRKRVKEDRV